MKAFIKRVVVKFPYVSLAVARLHAITCSLAAFRFRIRYVAHCHVAWSARVTGWNAIELGRNAVVGAGSWLNVNDRRVSTPSLRIGSNSFIGQDNFFTVGREIIIREYCLTASRCAFIGSSHVAANPERPYSTTGTTNSDTIYIGVNCFFGYGATVIGNVKIGHGSIVGAGTTVREDVPPFSIVVGSPSRVVRRYCFGQKNWIKPEQVRDVLFPDEETYLRNLRETVGFPLQPISAAATFFSDV